VNSELQRIRKEDIGPNLPGGNGKTGKIFNLFVGFEVLTPVVMKS
jgi:hypothetical protein